MPVFIQSLLKYWNMQKFLNLSKSWCYHYQFSSTVLTNDEYETLRYGLKHGIMIKPKDNEIFAIAGDIYDQINRKGICKKIRYL